MDSNNKTLSRQWILGLGGGTALLGIIGAFIILSNNDHSAEGRADDLKRRMDLEGLVSKPTLRDDWLSRNELRMDDMEKQLGKLAGVEANNAELQKKLSSAAKEKEDLVRDAKRTLDVYERRIGDSPDTYYLRTCNEGLAVENTPGVCLISLTHQFDEIFGYRCRDSLSIGLLPICGQTDFSGCHIVDVHYECPRNPRRPYQIFCDPDRATIFEFTYECSVARPLLTPIYHRITYLGSSRNDSTCVDLENEVTCTQLSEVCTEGPETRLINGVAITKDCWVWQRNYDCISFRPATDCTLAENDPACRFDHQECLSIAEDGSCTMYEKIYHCTVPGGPTGEIAVSCGEDIYCLDGSCDSITREANTSFPEAAAALQMLAQQPGEFDKTDYTIFDGDNLTCPKTLFGVVNCCTDDGFLVDIGLVGCDGEAKALAEKKVAGLCHYVGTYCSSKIFGICVKKRKSYCCFKGKLSRIIMEQGREQLGISWGEAKEPNCEGFTVAQFQSLDFSQMDLSEFYADAQATTILRSEEGVINDLKSRVEAYYDQ